MVLADAHALIRNSLLSSILIYISTRLLLSTVRALFLSLSLFAFIRQCALINSRAALLTFWWEEYTNNLLVDFQWD